MLNRLATSTLADAREEIERLQALPVLAAWSVAIDAARFDHVRAARAARFEHATAAHVTQTLCGRCAGQCARLGCVDDPMAWTRLKDESVVRKATSSTGSGGIPSMGTASRGSRTNAATGCSVCWAPSCLLAAWCSTRRARMLAIRAPTCGRRSLSAIGGASFRSKSSWKITIRFGARGAINLMGGMPRTRMRKGVGIYLVLWFGRRPRGRGRGHAVPRTAHELQSQLRSQIPETDTVRLSVRVLDFSERVASGSKRRTVRRSR